MNRLFNIPTVNNLMMMIIKSNNDVSSIIVIIRYFLVGGFKQIDVIVFLNYKFVSILIS